MTPHAVRATGDISIGPALYLPPIAFVIVLALPSYIGGNNQNNSNIDNNNHLPSDPWANFEDPISVDNRSLSSAPVDKGSTPPPTAAAEAAGNGDGIEAPEASWHPSRDNCLERSFENNSVQSEKTKPNPSTNHDHSKSLESTETPVKAPEPGKGSPEPTTGAAQS
ncbi:hypothetical protein GMORB2_0478 [Geosmithia morbida]|uniref:Uncharacterized protein n=1 Tax=Geosmithia morbida TaxID=1094350 RepID=A0A9P4Z119_9HYPO|nr:uncharacterized protein GMORB2_0478 [Geosmithia morbida]KAF4126741.1 hypothetical protein GMORB2_0478 [Geosmithia morbida]